MQPPVIHWFRRDLRVTDNTSLQTAIASGGEVIPVYILSDWKHAHRWTGANRQGFLCDCLASLDANLRHLGSRLILRCGEPAEELAKLAVETGAKQIFFNTDYDPFTSLLEARVKKNLAEQGVGVTGCKDLVVAERRELLTGGGQPFRVFTPYSKAWRKAVPPPAVHPAPRSLSSKFLSLPSASLPETSHWGLGAPGGGVLKGGERAARERWKKFLKEAVVSYSAKRDLPGTSATSRISQDLRFGLLSIREVFRDCLRLESELPLEERAKVAKFTTELIWREFYFQLLANFPEVLEWEFQEKFRGIRWPQNPGGLERWKEGSTGFPIVDAGMRELRETGFMHNRVRMITAMFLTKDLHVDWREGESWFLQQLTDGEIASNNGGWQWSAGTGADAAPYFRIQNPWTQTAKFDPDGIYIKKWIPELRDVDSKRFQKPPDEGERLSKAYPVPVCDHSAERDRTLEFFAAWNKRAR